MASAKDPADLLWGAALLAVGIIALLANFGLLFWSGLLWDRWWPLLLIAIGVLLLVTRRQRTAAPPSPAPPGDAAPPENLSTVPAAGSGPAARPTFPTGAVILIGIGAAFLLQDVLGRNVFPALVIMAIGIALLLRDRWPR